MVKKALIVILILLPFVQLALLPLVNRIEPIMFGLPFFHFWSRCGLLLRRYARLAFIRCKKRWRT